jgi:hypothetical protein
MIRWWRHAVASLLASNEALTHDVMRSDMGQRVCMVEGRRPRFDVCPPRGPLMELIRFSVLLFQGQSPVAS